MRKLLTRIADYAFGIITAFAVTAALAQGVPQIVMQAGIPAVPALISNLSNTVGVYFRASSVGITGHPESGAIAPFIPTASLCGAAVDAGSTDSDGSITNVGTTTCTITFGAVFGTKPSCIVTDNTTNRATMTAVQSTTAIVITGITAADALSWKCTAKSGG